MISKDPAWRKIQLNKILWITAIWIIISLIEFLYHYLILLKRNCLPDEMNPGLWVAATTATGLFAGLIGGTITVTYFENWFRTHSYFKAFAMVIASFSIAFFLISSIGFTIVSVEQLNSLEMLTALFSRVISIEFLRNYIFWLVVVLLTTVGLLVNDKYGPGVLRDFLLGRYFRPRQEERIFMFLDLRGSTSIAERLGQRAYFFMLKELFEDITQPILYTRGEIYQYVGDEIVVSWPKERGKDQANCIRCYFEIKEVLQRKAPVYFKKYGISPEMKAGLHYGEVLAGEIGVVKRDITYTGDVLNTASRIQSKCNTMGVDILLSKSLLEMLKLAPDQYQPKRLGSVELRGKSEEVIIYTL